MAYKNPGLFEWQAIKNKMQCFEGQLFTFSFQAPHFCLFISDFFRADLVYDVGPEIILEISSLDPEGKIDQRSKLENIMCPKTSRLCHIGTKFNQQVENSSVSWSERNNGLHVKKLLLCWGECSRKELQITHSTSICEDKKTLLNMTITMAGRIHFHNLQSYLLQCSFVKWKVSSYNYASQP